MPSKKKDTGSRDAEEQRLFYTKIKHEAILEISKRKQQYINHASRSTTSSQNVRWAHGLAVRVQSISDIFRPFQVQKNEPFGVNSDRFGRGTNSMESPMKSVLQKTQVRDINKSNIKTAYTSHSITNRGRKSVRRIDGQQRSRSLSQPKRQVKLSQVKFRATTRNATISRSRSRSHTHQNRVRSTSKTRSKSRDNRQRMSAKLKKFGLGLGDDEIEQTMHLLGEDFADKMILTVPKRAPNLAYEEAFSNKCFADSMDDARRATALGLLAADKSMKAVKVTLDDNLEMTNKSKLNRTKTISQEIKHLLLEHEHKDKIFVREIDSDNNIVHKKISTLEKNDRKKKLKKKKKLSKTKLKKKNRNRNQNQMKNDGIITKEKVIRSHVQATATGLLASKIQPSLEIFYKKPFQVPFGGPSNKRSLLTLFTATLDPLVGEGGVRLEFREVVGGQGSAKHIFLLTRQHVRSLLGGSLHHGPMTRWYQNTPDKLSQTPNGGLPISVIQSSCLALANLVRFNLNTSLPVGRIASYDTVCIEQMNYEKEKSMQRETWRLKRHDIELENIRKKKRLQRRQKDMEQAEISCYRNGTEWNQMQWMVNYLKQEEAEERENRNKKEEATGKSLNDTDEEQKNLSQVPKLELSEITMNDTDDVIFKDGDMLNSLPDGWEAYHDDNSDATYFWHRDTGAIRWERPGADDNGVDVEKTAMTQSLIDFLDTDGDGKVSELELESALTLQRGAKPRSWVRPVWLTNLIGASLIDVFEMNRLVNVDYDGTKYLARISGLTVVDGGSITVKYTVDGSTEKLLAKDIVSRVFHVSEDNTDSSSATSTTYSPVKGVVALGQPLVVEYEGVWHSASVFAVSLSGLIVRYDQDGSMEEMDDTTAISRVRPADSKDASFDATQKHENNDQVDILPNVDITNTSVDPLTSFLNKIENAFGKSLQSSRDLHPGLGMCISKDIWGYPVNIALCPRLLLGPNEITGNIEDSITLPLSIHSNKKETQKVHTNELQAHTSRIILRKAWIQSGRPLLATASLVGAGPGVFIVVEDIHAGRNWPLHIGAEAIKSLLWNWLPSLLIDSLAMAKQRVELLLGLLYWDESGAMYCARESQVSYRQEENGKRLCMRVPLGEDNPARICVSASTTQLETIWRKRASIEAKILHAKELSKRGLHRDALPIMLKAKLARDELWNLMSIEQNVMRHAGGVKVRLHWQTPESYKAVILVQRNFRGYLGRGKASKRRETLKKENNMSTHISRCWRGYDGRKIASKRRDHLQMLNEKAITLQNCVRSYLSMCHVIAIRRWVYQKKRIYVLQRSCRAMVQRRNRVQERWIALEGKRISEEEIGKAADWAAGERKRNWAKLTPEEKEQKKEERRSARKKARRVKKSRMIVREQIKVQSIRDSMIRSTLDKQEAERLAAKQAISKYGLEDWKFLCSSRDPKLCHPSWEGHFGFIAKKWNPAKEHPVFHKMGFKRVEVDDSVPFALRRLKSYQLMVMKGKKKFNPRVSHPSSCDISIFEYQIPVHKNHPAFSGYDYKVDGREAITETPKWDFANMYDPADKVLPCFVCRRPNGKGMLNCPRCSHRSKTKDNDSISEGLVESNEEVDTETEMEETRKKMAAVFRDGGGLGDLALLGKSLKRKKKKIKKKKLGYASHNNNGAESIDTRGPPGSFNFAVAAQVRIQMDQRTRKLVHDSGVKQIDTKDAREAAKLKAIEEAQTFAAEALKHAMNNLKGIFTKMFIKAIPVGGVTEITVEENDTVEYLYFLYRANAGPDGISNKTNLYIPSQRGIFRVSEERIKGNDMWAEWAPADFTMKDWGFSTNQAKVAVFQCSEDHDYAARQLLIGFLRRNLSIGESKLLTMMDMRMRRFPDQMPTDVKGDAMQGLCVHMFMKVHEMQLISYARSVIEAKQKEESQKLEKYKNERDEKLNKTKAVRDAATMIQKIKAKMNPFKGKQKKKRTALEVRLERNAAMIDKFGTEMDSEYSTGTDDVDDGHKGNALMYKMDKASTGVRDVHGGLTDDAIRDIGINKEDETKKKSKKKKIKKKKTKKTKKKKPTADEINSMSLEERRELLEKKKRRRKRK